MATYLSLDKRLDKWKRGREELKLKNESHLYASRSRTKDKWKYGDWAIEAWSSWQR